MIRKKHQPREENNYAAFENYIQNEELRRLYENPEPTDPTPIENTVMAGKEPKATVINAKQQVSFHFPLEKIQELPGEFKIDTKKISEKIKEKVPRIKSPERKISARFLRYGFSILALFLGLYFMINAPLYYYRFVQTKNSNAATAPAPTPTPILQRTAPTKESVLLVPKLKVNAPIVFVKSIAENDIKEGLRNGVTHYYGTAKPGENGNVFISGHSSNYWWEKGNFNYVFSTLDKLQAGDTATIYHNGLVYEYTVTNKKVVNPTDVSVLKQTPEPTLTLMTCTPPGTDWRRLIVTFKQTYPEKNPETVKPSPAPAKNIKKSPSLLPSDRKSFWDSVTKLFGL